MSFLHYKQAHPPTVVEHCVQAKVVTVDEVNLVVAKTTVLEIYRTRDRRESETTNKSQHLVLVGRFPVHGVITGLAKVTLIPGRPDQLIVCTKDAKVSILSFDRCIHRLVNVSLHWFEDEAIKNGMMSNPHETIICVDPSNRCCVLYTFGRCLTILPFNRKEDIGFNDEIANDTSRKDSRVMLHHTQSTHGSNAVTTSHSVGQDLSVWGDDVGALRRMIRPSYTRPITDYDARIRTVHDMAFLHGYFEPTLVVLYESNDTWEGNLGSRSDTISIIALSLNLVDHQQHVIWHVTDLPYDLRRIQLVPEPLGGLILLGTNSMVYLNQSTPAYGVSLNSNMDGCTKFPLVPQPDAVLALNDSVSVFLDESRMFLSTANGSIYSVVLKIDGRNVIGFAIQKAGASVIPACICVITPGLLFLGSRLGDSLCMTYEDTLDKNDEEANVHLLNALKMATASTNENGGKSKEKSDFSTKRLAEGDLDDDLFIYEVDDKGTEHTDDSILSFKVCDILMNVGPITDFCFGEPAYVSDEYVREDRYDLELVTCSGHGKNGALCLMQRGVRPQVLTTFPLETRNAMWAVYGSRGRTGEDPIVDNKAGNADSKREDEEEKKKNEFHSYLFLSTDDSTMVLRTDEELAQVKAEPHSFHAGVQTLLVANVGSRGFILQVHPQGLVLLRDLDELQDITLSDTLTERHSHAAPTGTHADTNTPLLTDAPKGPSTGTDPHSNTEASTHTHGEISIISADIADPYVSVLCSDGQVIVWLFDSATCSLVRTDLNVPNCPLSAVCLYRDEDMVLFADSSSSQNTRSYTSAANGDSSAVREGNKRPAAELSDEDDDADLYGSDADEEENAETPTKKRKASTSGQTGSESLGLGAENPPTQIPTYLFVTSAVGTLSAYDVATGVECFRVPNFCDGPEILADSYTGMDMDEDTDAATEKSTETKSSAHAKANGPIVVEIKLVALGKRKELLHLLAITSAGDLNVYRAFQCVPPTRGDRTKPMYKQRGASCLGGGGNEILRFAKLDHEVILRPMDNVEDDWAFGPAPTGDTTKVDESTAPESTDLVGTNVAGAEAACSRWLTSVREHRKQIFPFFNISTYNGVVITGEHTRPWWLIATRKGLRTHPMYVDTGAIYFTPFHNVNCSHGFMYFNNERELRICQLPQHLLYDSAWPSRKVPIRATPHHIAYHVESKQYVIAKSVDEEVLEVARLTNDTKDRQPEKFEGGPRYIYPREPKFSVTLISPLSWEEIDAYEFPLYEHITCMDSVTLRSEETASGMKPFIAVSTMTVMGEETTPKGKVYLFEVIEVVPEPGKPQTNHKLKKVYDKVQKGPVTALSAINGLLVTAQGQKIYIWLYQNRMLVGKAFIDAQLYTVKLSVARSFVLAADMFNSVSLLRYQEEEKTFSLITRDFSKIPLFTSAYVVDDTTLAAMVTDMDGNVQVFGYAPDDPDSLGGTKLIRKVDIHVGSLVSSINRVEARPPPGSRYPKRRHVNVCGALDGSISYIQPIDEKLYRRLNMIQTRLTSQLNHNLGLNPKAFRLIKQENSVKLSNAAKNVLDGELLSKFSSLSLSMRKELAKQIGSDHIQILQSLQEVDHATTVL